MPSPSLSLLSSQPLAVISQTLSTFGIDLALDSFATTFTSKRLINDSREVQSGDIFCAVIGHDQDGNHYIDNAVKLGASLVLAQCKQQAHHGEITWHKASKVAIVKFYQLGHHLFELASCYYQSPQRSMQMIGITGTNGKTSTSQIIASLLESINKPCGIIGTIGAGRLNQLAPLNNTTPGATQLLNILADFHQQNINHVAMEVSSHALAQRRVNAELFDISVFTNLSRDHLDYHKSMEEYAQAKFNIFSQEAEQIAIVNGDDEQAKKWLSRNVIVSPLIVYGRDKSLQSNARFVFADDIKHHAHGVTFNVTTHLGEITIESALMGDFNVDNLLAAISVLLAQKISLNDIQKAAAQLQPVIGRMESFNATGKATAVVDYAHTPDALDNALDACRQHCDGDLWVVFGCGGNRDKGKRLLMGAVAEKAADHVIVTNDNPRNEKPEAIANDILSGCQQPEKITVMLDRQQAVLSALSQAKEKDMVLLAGKGHENYIIIGDETLPYDERALVRSTYKSEDLL